MYSITLLSFSNSYIIVLLDKKERRKERIKEERINVMTYINCHSVKAHSLYITIIAFLDKKERRRERKKNNERERFSKN